MDILTDFLNMNDAEPEPLRSLDDFLLNSARFSMPNFADTERWTRRVKANLVYYQTNYFLTSIIIFLIVGIMHPVQMMLGVLSVAGLFSGYNYLCNNQAALAEIKQKYPLASLVAILTGGYLIVSMLGSVMVFMFGVFLPLAVMFIHASMRLRNTKNKLSNIKEKISFRKSPMTVLLDELGMRFEGYDD